MSVICLYINLFYYIFFYLLKSCLRYCLATLSKWVYHNNIIIYSTVLGYIALH